MAFGSSLRWSADAVLLRVAGSVFLMWLQSRRTRRRLNLLRFIGRDPWESGWDRLWSEPCLYLVFPFPLRVCKHGLAFYVGESICFSRRFREHLCRMVDVDGCTQQPFYQYVRQSCCNDSQLFAALSFLMLIPIHCASADKVERLSAERVLVGCLGALNPPHVYSLLVGVRGQTKGLKQGLRIFGSQRKLCRLRASSLKKEGPLNTVLRNRVKRRVWKDGLQLTSLALQGVKFNGCDAASLAAWNLSPGDWAYVAHQIDRCSEGWRRRRGLAVLQRIASRRRDLCFPFSQVSLSIPWVGTLKARKVMLRALQRLLHSWRNEGRWIPLRRHAKCCVTWSRSRKLRDVLSNSSRLNDWLSGKIHPSCVCHDMLSAEPTWPSVTVDGVEHIAASAGTVPWPEELQCLAKWPATLSLPPRWDDIAACVRSSFRSFRKRCKIRCTDSSTEAVIQECVAEAWSLFMNFAQDDFPISWKMVAQAKCWLGELFVSVFDHNLSTLAVMCPKLVFDQACKLLDFNQDNGCPDPNIIWHSADTSRVRDALQSMALLNGLSDRLQPRRLSNVPRSSWQVGTVAVLPKWKAPGLKWRLIINKHATPCCALHSLVSKALDILLEAFPTHAVSDFLSVHDMIGMVHDFNSFSAEFGFDIGATAAADMKDCFRHLPCPDGVKMWQALADYWHDRHVFGVSVPSRFLKSKGVLGRCDDPGWTYCSFHDIGRVVEHFARTNFIFIDGFLGRELKGVPQGDALSSAFLRLWKWFREYHCGFATANLANCISLPNSRCKLIHLNGSNFLALDVSYRDDLRMFFTWRRGGKLTQSHLLSWSWVQFRNRFECGSMKLDDADPCVFVGLNCVWNDAQLALAPNLDDAFAGFSYDRIDWFPIMPWCSWMPPQQRVNAVRGLMCRVFYLSSNRTMRRDSMKEALMTLVFNAGFPSCFVRRHCLNWASRWVPKGSTGTCSELYEDAIACTEWLLGMCVRHGVS